jgi:hypothetical protein
MRTKMSPPLKPNATAMFPLGKTVIAGEDWGAQ